MSKSTTPQPATTFAEAFPASRKVYEEQSVATPHGDVRIRVPVREVSLTGGEPPVRLYDTSGPQGHDPREGLPKLRAEWVAPRRASAGSSQGGRCVTQLHYARKGEITPEMAFVAVREVCRPSSSATRSRAGAPSSPPTSTTQLVAVTVGTHRSEFAHDGFERRVRIVEKENSIT